MPGGGSGFIDLANAAPLHGGTYVTLVPPDDLSGMTLIVETMADSSCLKRQLGNFSLTFTTKAGLPGPGTELFVWKSTQYALFMQQSSITIGPDSSFTLVVEPDALVTLSTVAGARKGSFPDSPIPPQVCEKT